MCQIYFSLLFIWIANTTALNCFVCAGVGAVASVFCPNSMNEFLTKCSYICFVAWIEMDFNFMSDEALLMSVICSNWLNNEWPLCVRVSVCVRMSTSLLFTVYSFIFYFRSFCISFFRSLGPVRFLLVFQLVKWINISNVSSIDERTIILDLKGKRLINTSVYIFLCRFTDAVVIFVIGIHSSLRSSSRTRSCTRTQIGKKSQKLNTNKCVAGEMRKHNTRTLI